MNEKPVKADSIPENLPPLVVEQTLDTTADQWPARWFSLAGSIPDCPRRESIRLSPRSE